MILLFEFPEDGDSPHGHRHDPLAAQDLGQPSPGQLEDHVAGEEEPSHVIDDDTVPLEGSVLINRT